MMVVGATGVTQRRFASAAEWERAWLARPDLPMLVRELADEDAVDPREAFHGAVYFLAGALEREGFVLFRNGGLPLLERRAGELRQEILVRLGPHPARGAVVPLALHIHVSHAGLREIRERYWPAMGHIPTSIAGGNVGLLQTPGTYDIWNVAGERALSELRAHLETSLIPYLDLLENPRQLRRALWEGGVPLLDQATATELLLYEYGRSEARAYVEEVLLTDDERRGRFERIYRGLTGVASLHYRPGEPLRNVAVIARAHRVMGRL